MTAALIRWRCPVLPGPDRVVLTARQADILAGICAGYTNDRIGADLGIAGGTVKTHVRDLSRLFGGRSRAALAALAASQRVEIIVEDTRSVLL